MRWRGESSVRDRPGEARRCPTQITTIQMGRYVIGSVPHRSNHSTMMPAAAFPVI